MADYTGDVLISGVATLRDNQFGADYPGDNIGFVRTYVMRGLRTIDSTWINWAAYGAPSTSYTGVTTDTIHVVGVY